MYGLLLAFTAALLFGASAPASKVLLQSLQPLQLAGLLYVGAALGMLPLSLVAPPRAQRAGLDRVNRWRLAGVIVFGGIVAPILLLLALQMTTATTVSLLLNAEMIATAVLGVALFHEHLGGLGWVAVSGVVLSSLLLSGDAGMAGWMALVLVGGACVCWGLDNHLSALIDGMTPIRSTLWKGTLAGGANLLIGCAVAPLHASWSTVAAALAVGAVSYGASIALHVAAAQRLGATRAQAVFASAPFLGAASSVLFLGEVVSTRQVGAALLFLLSVALLMRSQHLHAHAHDAADHIHAHTHDDGHHVHEHAEPPAGAHTHQHQHKPLVHAHPHWPDLHHRHSH